MEQRDRQVVRAVWGAGRVSRSQLRDLTGLTPNGVGVIADSLVQRGILRECPPEPGAGAGRPRVPLEIDPTRLHFIGLAMGPGSVELSRVGLGGGAVARRQVRRLADAKQLVAAAAQMLADAGNDRTLGVGISVTGFVDPVEHAILLSSAQPGRGRVSLAPVFEAAGDLPVVLENDMHALAAQWLLARRSASIDQDVVLVSIGDGRLGAAMLIDGRPNRGCATGANELGHTRFFVETRRCFCGHVGCLEQIVTSEQLRKLDRSRRGTLGERAARYAGDDAAMEEVLKYLACGIANMVNFVRPHRLVLIDGLGGNSAFDAALVRGVREGLLSEIHDRIAMDVAHEPVAGSADSAAWLAIAEFLHGGWGSRRRGRKERAGRSGARREAMV